jgi:hypothetical protein
MRFKGKLTVHRRSDSVRVHGQYAVQAGGWSGTIQRDDGGLFIPGDSFTLTLDDGSTGDITIGSQDLSLPSGSVQSSFTTNGPPPAQAPRPGTA